MTKLAHKKEEEESSALLQVVEPSGLDKPLASGGSCRLAGEVHGHSLSTGI